MSFGPNSWSYGLIHAIEDASKVIFRSEELICIKDLYPKAINHFLILPERNDLDNIYDLRKDDVQLVEEMELMGINSIELVGNKNENFRMGFHLQPSMKRLHLHVISKDFDSPCLKNKKHWNSFTTDFLIHPSKVVEELNELGEVQKPSEEEIKKYLETSLKCITCNYKPKHMPDLKKHLLTHVSVYKGLR